MEQYEMEEQYREYLFVLGEAIRRMERPEVEVPHEVFVERFCEGGYSHDQEVAL
jgi:hypothetical protein